MSDNKLSDNLNDDLNVVSIDELLATIDELESNNISSKQSDYETVLNDGIVDDIDTNNIDLTNTDSLYTKKRRVADKGSDRKNRNTIWKSIFGWIRLIIISMLIAFVLNKFVIANAFIPSGSMESTIMTGDRVIGLRLSYLLSSPKRGDIVIFKFPDDESKLYIKRIIGLPGDKVEIRDGLVYINDSSEPLDEPYLSVTPRGNFGPYQVPEDSYFMLGDNRNVSKDSRYWENTFVSSEKIIAKAYLRYYPSVSIVK